MNQPLFYHKTGGGAEYLSLRAIEGTTEGDMHYAVIRLDGQPELLHPINLTCEHADWQKVNK